MTTAHPRPIQPVYRHKALLLVMGGVLLVVAYCFASLAINSGRLLEYAVALLFLFWGLRYLVGFGKAFIGSKKHQATKA